MGHTEYSEVEGDLSDSTEKAAVYAALDRVGNAVAEAKKA